MAFEADGDGVNGAGSQHRRTDCFFGEVREGLPGSTLERGTHVEKRSGTWETLRVPGLKREYETAAAWHTVSEPTPAETQTQVGRSLNSGDAGFIRQTG
jgi:hypothetical protein